MTSKTTQVVIASIGAAVTLITAYWQFVYKQRVPNEIQYSGRVVNLSMEVIPGAKVSVLQRGVARVEHTDTNGFFFMKLNESIVVALVRVEAAGYKVDERNVPITGNVFQDVRLTPDQPSPPERPVNAQTNENRRGSDNNNSNGPRKHVRPKNNPQVSAHLSRADALFNKALFKEALDECNNALEIEPRNQRALKLRKNINKSIENFNR